MDEHAKPLGDRLYANLGALTGINVYWAGKIYRPEQPYEASKSEITSSDLLIEVLTKRTKIEGEDVWLPPTSVREEIIIAKERGIQILPFVEKGVKVEGFLRYFSRYVPFAYTDEGIFNMYRKIINFIRTKEEQEKKPFPWKKIVAGAIAAGIGAWAAYELGKRRARAK